jgi:dihydroorotate dehydrogenase
VPEDLAFLHITPAALHTANARLIPLIAHDRAGFGGALVSDGVAILLLALWGFRQGTHWVWWTLAGAGICEFIASVAIHWAVGYTNVWHLTPTFLAALPYALGLALSYPYLCMKVRI